MQGDRHVGTRPSRDPVDFSLPYLGEWISGPPRCPTAYNHDEALYTRPPRARQGTPCYHSTLVINRKAPRQTVWSGVDQRLPVIYNDSTERSTRGSGESYADT